MKQVLINWGLKVGSLRRMGKFIVPPLEGSCSYCGKPLRFKAWFNPFARPITDQCDRLICRLKTGHWLQYEHHRRIVMRKFTISIPTVRSTRIR